MPSPFPGMDPYLESPKHRHDFHIRFLSEWSDALNHQLPSRYLARIEERISSAQDDEGSGRRIRIVRHPDRTLVAVLELLSPWNKVNPGRREYLGHRQELLRQPVHLIELDLLVAGQRLPVGGALPTGNYFAMVTRWDRRPDCEVYAWSVRQRLPALRIPLTAPDPDLRLDLQPIFGRVFDAGRCAEAIEYGDALEAPLADDDRAWARERGCLA